MVCEVVDNPACLWYNAGMLKEKDKARFWRKVEVRGEDECWEWTGGSRNAYGYGQFRLNGRMVKVHRISYELSHGSIPEGMLVCHHCDNPPCANPSHLFLGTDKDNAIDREMKGRGHDQNGEKNNRAKLTDAQVSEIRERYTGKRGEQAALAREYTVSKMHISRILKNEMRKG